MQAARGLRGGQAESAVRSPRSPQDRLSSPLHHHWCAAQFWSEELGAQERLLFSSVLAGDLRLCVSLLLEEVDPNARAQDGCAPLHAACLAPFFEDVLVALELATADLNAEAEVLGTPLHAACRAGGPKHVAWFCAQPGTDINRLHRGTSALRAAVALAELAAMELEALLDKKEGAAQGKQGTAPSRDKRPATAASTQGGRAIVGFPLRNQSSSRNLPALQGSPVLSAAQRQHALARAKAAAKAAAESACVLLLYGADAGGSDEFGSGPPSWLAALSSHARMLLNATGEQSTSARAHFSGEAGVPSAGQPRAPAHATRWQAGELSEAAALRLAETLAPQLLAHARGGAPALRAQLEAKREAKRAAELVAQAKVQRVAEGRRPATAVGDISAHSASLPSGRWLTASSSWAAEGVHAAPAEGEAAAADAVAAVDRARWETSGPVVGVGEGRRLSTSGWEGDLKRGGRGEAGFRTGSIVREPRLEVLPPTAPLPPRAAPLGPAVQRRGGSGGSGEPLGGFGSLQRRQQGLQRARQPTASTPKGLLWVPPPRALAAAVSANWTPPPPSPGWGVGVVAGFVVRWDFSILCDDRKELGLKHSLSW
ncbi:hypothetical protein T492DRAFT_1061869 [Pavlovales sp. CCMP2436]|nr:hypothetical protein T492DRAFT_1061869 [Pavlovales sp. CCMP2436]